MSKPALWDSHSPRTSGTCQTPSQCTHLDLALSAAAGKAFTTVLAGFAFTFCSTPNIILTPALVAGLVLVLMRTRPGMANTPVFLTPLVAMAARDSNTTEHSFVFKSCSVAIALIMAPLVMALAPAFIVFIVFIAFIAH